MANTAWKFIDNVRNEVMKPAVLAYDSAFGLVGTALIDMTGLDNGLAMIAEAPGLDSTRTNQLGAGLTYATLSALERATKHTLGAHS